MSSSQPWYRDAFERGYLTVYAHRDEASAAREAEFVATELGLASGDLLLDAACGAGRHARALAARGARVVGVDLSGDLLAAARAIPSDGVRYVRADVRALPFAAGAFDHAVSLFTSFGYFDAEGDRRHVRSLRACLRAGGRFLLDFLNAPAVIAGLVPHSEKTVDGATVTERRSIADGRVVKHVTVVAGSGAAPVVWSESVRLYDRAETESLLRAAAFRVRAVHGDLAGRAWSEDAPRLVVVAEAA